MGKLIICLTTLVMFFPAISLGYNDTSSYYKCYNRTGGSWEYGRAPSICDVGPFLNEEYVQSEFKTYIFEDIASVTGERKRYMTELHAMIKKMASWYIKERNPAVGEEELRAWIEAAYATANQESYWSHYRISKSKRLQMMRGDYGHGHGLFQVDDRWHFNAIGDGRAANIVMNGIYSLEEYYNAWERSAKVWCIKSKSDYYNRSRAAYAAYNGGPSKICRWTNPNDKWARNDKGYRQKLDAKGWRKYITDFELASTIDIGCVVDGGESCNAGAQAEELSKGKLYQLKDGRVCAFNQESLSCVESSKTSSCLAAHFRDDFSRTPSIRKAKDELIEGVAITNLPSHSICSLSVKGLYSIGEVISVNKRINMRATPGGKLLSTTKIGAVFQILDYAVEDYPSLERYYFIKSGGQYGYIYTGVESDYGAWAVKSIKTPEHKFIAQKGESIQVIAPDGISYLKQGIRSERRIPQGEVLTVDYYVLTSINSLYYSVSYRDESVLVYAGTVGELQNLSKDIVIIGNEHLPVWGQLVERIYYMNVRSCKSTSCKVNGIIAGPRIGDGKFEVLETSGDWISIRSGSIEGFIKKKYAVIEG
ncbi:MAG: hypothetical protein KAG61_02935 [Bacteriovoracaceae bacterium]|nr:hypothetical protein [Bacteriovoracaceae bacterium]